MRIILTSVQYTGETAEHGSVKFIPSAGFWTAIVSARPPVFSKYVSHPGAKLIESTPLKEVFQVEIDTTSLAVAMIVFKGQAFLKTPTFFFCVNDSLDVTAAHNEGAYVIGPLPRPTDETMDFFKNWPSIERVECEPVNADRKHWKLIVHPQKSNPDSLALLFSKCIATVIHKAS